MSVIQAEAWGGGDSFPLFQNKTQMLHTSLLLTFYCEVGHMATLNCKVGWTTVRPAKYSVITEKRIDTKKQLEIFTMPFLIVDAQ